MEQSFTAFTEKLQTVFKANGLAPASSEAGRLFYRLTERLLEVNRRMNLTAVTDVEDILVKHYADCAAAA